MQKRVSLTKKYTLITSLLVASVSGVLWAHDTESPRDGWHTDLEKGKKLAQQEGKDLLIKFTRSQGCGWCLKLEKEVISQTSFKEQMSQNYILVIINYPRDHRQWSPEFKKRHEQLKKYYHVNHLPNLVFADANGRPYESKSYRNQNPEVYFKEIIKIHDQRKNRDAALAAAQHAEGKVKARLLEKGLAEVSRKYHLYYPKVLAEITKADPDDTSGFMGKIRVSEIHKAMHHLLASYYEENNYLAIPAVIDDYIKTHQPKNEALQIALLYKVKACYMAHQYQQAKMIADEVIKVNAASRSASYALSIKKRIERIDKKEK